LGPLLEALFLAPPAARQDIYFHLHGAEPVWSVDDEKEQKQFSSVSDIDFSANIGRLVFIVRLMSDCLN